MKDATRNLRKLAGIYPRIFPSALTWALPLADDIAEQIIRENRVRLRPDWIRQTLSSYSKSRIYLSAVADGKALVDLAGKEVRRPSPQEVMKASSILLEYPIDRCIQCVGDAKCST